MISLEQVQLLETRVAKAVEYVQKVTAENVALVSEKNGLKAKLDANKKRIDELEVLIMRFKEDQSRIEDGIIAALDRLSQFEEAFENSLKETPTKSKTSSRASGQETSKAEKVSKKIFFEIPEKEKEDTAEDNDMADNDTMEQELSPEDELDIF